MKKRVMAMRTFRRVIAGGIFILGTVAGALIPVVSTFAATAPTPTGVSVVYDAASSSFDVNGTMGNANDSVEVNVRPTGTSTWYAANFGTPPQGAEGLLGLPQQDITGMGEGAGGHVAFAAGSSYDFQVQEYDGVEGDTPSTLEFDNILFGNASAQGTTYASSPTNLNVAISGTNLNATWSAPSSVGSPALSGYEVQLVSEDTGGVVQTLTTSGTSASFCGLAAAVAGGDGASGEYEVLVTPINGGNASPNSASSGWQVITPGATGGQCLYTAGQTVSNTISLPSGGSNFALFDNLTTGSAGLSSSFSGSASSSQNLVLGYKTTAPGSSTAMTYPVAEANFNLSSGNVDGSQFSYQTDLTNYKAFAHNVAQQAVGGSYTLFIPAKSGDKAVGICPGVTSLSAVTTSCPNLYYLTNGGSANGASATLVTIGGIQYWQVSGLTGTGGFSTSAVGGTPDDGFSLNLSNPAFVIVIGVIAAGILLLLARAKVSFARK